MQNENLEKIAQEQIEEAKALASNIEEKPITVTIKTGEGGKIFGSISTKEVAKEAIDQLGIDIDKKKMNLTEPIKTLGTHIVSVKLHRDVTAQLTVKVIEE